MKRNSIFFVLILAIAGIGVFRCTNPLKNVVVSVDSNIFHHTVLLQVASSSGASIDDATVSLSGVDASKIFDLDGHQTYSIAGGVLALGVNPNSDPTGSAKVNFNVLISKPGYLPVNIPVSIGANDSSSLKNVTLVSIANPPAGVEVETHTLPVDNDGTVTTDTTINTTAGNGSVEETGVTFPTGTQFKNIDGNVVSGSNLVVTILTANTADNDALSVFPGGGLTNSAIVAANGTTSGALLPAGLSEVSVTLKGTQVTGFTTPIQIALQLDPNYNNPVTGTKIKAGDVLDIYSFSTAKGFWQYESAGTVVSVGGKLVVYISTSHLTWFMVGNLTTSCGSKLQYKLEASWLPKGITSPIIFKVFSAVSNGTVADKIIAQTTLTATNGDTLTLVDMPQMPIIIKAYDVAGNVLASSNITDPCSAGRQNITIAKSPLTTNPLTTMQLYVRCPNKNAPVAILPTFYLYYKIAGSPNSAYLLLGKVTKGYISTNVLDITKKYDFKAIWGSTVKVVNNHSIVADNSATVGDNQSAGEIIGTKAGATNLDMLQQACDQLE
ncbi:hypothetical protein [Arachidicoccus sp.]|uniref:hypothetical protein n=1 Tax=Arachidicoccus sp. TaxID=1872624 RepID=UPI003D22EBDD